MRFITLNVKGASKTRKGFVPYQVAALMIDRPDFVALSEVAINRLADYEREFQRHGLTHVLSSVTDAASIHTGSRSVGTLIASRFTCTMRPDAQAAYNIPWPERLVSVTAATDAGVIEIDVAYIPYYYQGDPSLIEIKLQTLDRLYHGLARASERHRIVCGDFNIPLGETANGNIVSAGTSARYKRAHASAHNLLRGLADFGLYDVFRHLHGYAKQEYSWLVPGTGNGFRLDHILASQSLNAIACQYLHHFRQVHNERPWGPSPQALSDHSALEVVFDPLTLSKSAV